MAEDFPDDSLFRNSNVAYLEDVLNEKEKCEIRVQDGILMPSSITNLTSARNGYDQQSSLVYENSNHGCQLENSIKVRVENNEDNCGLPKPRTEEIKFLSFDFNDLSNVVEECKNSQITVSKALAEEKTSSVLQAHVLSEQNPPKTSAQLKSFSSNGTDSTSIDKTEEKSTRSKNSLKYQDSHSSGYSGTLTTTSKKGNKSGKSTQSKNLRSEKVISPEERSELSKKRGYQPLQLNITKTLRHDETYGKKKKVENSSDLRRSPVKTSVSLNASKTSDQADMNVRDNSTESYHSSYLETLSETLAANITNNIDDTLLTTQQRLQLESWGFPETILKQYARRGVTQMFPWQVECLCQPNVLSGGNLIYSAPTSAGKTLVAEILCIKTVLERKKKAIFILPFVSVVREKMFYFQDLLGSTGIKVEGFMGGHSPPGGFKSLDIAVCTIEKANGIVNRLLEDEGLSSLGAVVVDELHLLGDPFRGYLLELLLTKLKYMSRRKENVQIQIVGMSATLPNLSLLSTWLDAALYSTSYRPVPLSEFVKIGPQVFDNQLKLVRTINPEIKIKGDPDCIIYLCLETVVSGHSVLIFCPTKNWCESLALSIAEEFRNIGQNRDPNAPESLGYKLREELNANAILQTLEQLKRCPAGLDHLLARTVAFGVSFHHAGMTLDERDIIEGSFRQGTLRVIVATSTLSSGVNLPARRVIVRSPTFHGRLIDVLTYKQMVGRAGRMGKDTAGESFLICTKADQRLAEQLIKSSLRPVTSSLGQKGISSSLKRAILEVIASGVAQAPEELEIYVGCTLLFASAHNSSSKFSVPSGKSSSNKLLDPIFACVEHLRDNEFIRLQQCEDGTTKYVATPLGHACLSASISPDEGLTLFKELQRARQCFVLETELHIIYQVTPFSVSEQWGELDWLHVLSLWEKLTPEMKRVGELVGVEDRFIVRAMKGTVNLKSDKQHHRLLVHRRFYSALALNDLVNEIPITQVATKFGCSRGMLQSLQQTASTFAGMVTAFCRRLGWTSVEILVEQFQDRLQFGTHRELLDLLRLPLLNGPRARAVFNAGITSVTELTTADVAVVEDALLASTPFESAKGRDGESDHQVERRRRMKSVWVCGREGLTAREAAEQLIAEARELVQKELGVKNVNWEEAEVSITFDESRLSRSRNDLSVLQNASTVHSVIHESRNLENSSTYINLSRGGGGGGGEIANDPVFKVPFGGVMRKTPKKGTELKQTTKSSPSKVERILKSIEVEPVKVHQRPEKIIGDKFAGVPEPSKSNVEEETSSVIKSVETGRTDGSSGIPGGRIDVSNGILTGRTAVSTGVGRTDVSAGSTVESGISTGRTGFSAGSTMESGISTGRTGFLAGMSTRSTVASTEVGKTDVSAGSTMESGISTGRTGFSAGMSTRTTVASTEVGKTNVSVGSMMESGISAGKTGFLAGVSTKTADCSTGISIREADISPRCFVTREADSSRCSTKDEEISIVLENLSCQTSLSVCETSANSDMFEQNICEIDDALHSSVNSPAIEPQTSPQKNEKHEIALNIDKTSQSKNCDLFFESLSLSESAFKDLPAMRQPGDTKKESNANELANQGANSAISGDSGVGDAAFSLSSFSESAFLQSNLEKKAVVREETGSQDLLISQNELPVGRRSKRKSSSIDCSLHTPSPPWNLRSRRGSSSGSSRKQRRSIDDMFASPLLRDSPDNKNCSLFDESFEIDTQLRNAMDVNVKSDPANVENEKTSGQAFNSSYRGKRKTVESPSDSFGSVKSVAGRRTLSAKKKFFGSAKKNLTPTDLSTSAILGNENSVSQSTPLRPPPSGKGNGQQQVASVLTDSFLEAAFQSAFECDYATTTKKVSPPAAILKEPAPTVRLLQYSPGENELDGSREEEIPSTPHKKRKFDAKEAAELADYNRRRNRVGQPKQEVSSVEICKLRSSKTTGKDAQTIKEDGCEVMVCPPGKPVGLSVPRAKVEKRTCKTSEQIANEIKMNEENSKTGGTEKFSINPSSTVKKKNSDWSKINIIDVCESKETFNNFKKTILHRGTLSISLGCEHIHDSPIKKTVAIGTRVAGMPKTRRKSSLKLKEPVLQYEKIRLVSLSVCAGSTVCTQQVYHVALASDPLKGTLPVSFEDRMDLMRKLFSGDSSQTIVCFDLKEQYKMLFRCTRIAMSNIEGRDVKIADWLIEPEEKEKNLHAMALKYHPQTAKIAEMSGCKSARKAVSAALNTHLEVPARTRSCAEAIVCWHVSRAQITKLNDLQLLKSYTSIEMPVVLGFARLELNGIGFDREVALSLRERLKTEMSTLQERAYELAGRTFSLSSSSETARVIYQELGLGNVEKTQGARSFASSTASGVQKHRTNKQALSRLRQDHPLPEIILNWRKLSSVMSKTFYPLLKTQAVDRLYGRCILHSATGRISMHEPNLQNMPRDFDLYSDSTSFSVRSSFVPKAGNVFVAADYSQLELRLLAHLSGDITLRDILNSGRDVFLSIAMSWNKITEDEVTDEVRQRAKQVCYGMIYGIGKHALAEQLGVEDEDAEMFMISFKSAYPGVNTFLQDTVEECRSRGYVETMMGRRRYLPAINSSNPANRAHAERQAVNTTVQGSAADLTKAAMIAVDRQIMETFSPDSVILSSDFSSRGAYLVLQLHDELLYEVSQDYVDVFVDIVRRSMETAMALSVKLPVKVRIGPSWGMLHDVSAK